MARVSDYLNRLVPTAPDQEIGIGAFVALVRVRERYALTADAPVTPVEDGSFVNDHVILKPLTLTIEGDVSEVHLRASPLSRVLGREGALIANTAAQYLPPMTTVQIAKAAALAVDVADQIRGLDAALDRGEQILDYFGNRDASSKSIQEQFLDAVEGWHYGKQLITIDMPNRTHANMVIVSFQADKDNVSDSTSFTIQAQQLQFATTQLVEVAARNPSAGLGGQGAPAVDKGVQEGKPVESSFLSDVLGLF